MSTLPSSQHITYQPPRHRLSQTRHLFTPRIAGCHISLFYYGGFCYLMSRRYLDAARTFNTVLAYIQRWAGFQELMSHCPASVPTQVTHCVSCSARLCQLQALHRCPPVHP